jgi:hypothetical protein
MSFPADVKYPFTPHNYISSNRPGIIIVDQFRPEFVGFLEVLAN